MNPYAYDPYYNPYGVVVPSTAEHMEYYNNYADPNASYYTGYSYVVAVPAPVQVPMTQSKILVNPNFQPPKVHINPNFKHKSQIHVNPNVINVNYTQTIQENIPMNTKPKERNIHVNPNVIKLNFAQEKPEETAPVVLQKPIISTRTKLVRVQTTGAIPKSNYNKSQFKLVNKMSLNVEVNNVKPSSSPVEKKRKMSFKSKYKIVRKGCSGDDNKKSPILKSRFKLDRRSPKKLLRIGGIQNNANISKKVIRNGEVVSKLVTVNRLLYKKSPVKKSVIKKTLNKSLKTVLINGQKYKYGKNKLSLRKVALETSKLRKCRKNRTSITSTSQLRLNRSNTKGRSSSKLRKSNMVCAYYRKYGRCRNRENGKCIKKHDPNQIVICPRFLQGACVNEKCLLSHKVQPEKMPTCKFFLEGMCSKNGCPYLHVKINSRAQICKQFLEGYCEKAAECLNRHQYLCPDFEDGQSCPRVRCPYPHGSRVRNICLTTVAKKFKNKPKNLLAKQLHLAKTTEAASEDRQTVRYYSEASKSDKIVVKSATDTVVEQSIDIVSSSVAQTDKEPKRPKLGTLPAFIPFSESSNP